MSRTQIRIDMTLYRSSTLHLFARPAVGCTYRAQKLGSLSSIAQNVVMSLSIHLVSSSVASKHVNAVNAGIAMCAMSWSISW
jgi:ABC-type ATPase involved in cell division